MFCIWGTACTLLTVWEKESDGEATASHGDQEPASSLFLPLKAIAITTHFSKNLSSENSRSGKENHVRYQRTKLGSNPITSLVCSCQGHAASLGLKNDQAGKRFTSVETRVSLGQAPWTPEAALRAWAPGATACPVPA